MNCDDLRDSSGRSTALTSTDFQTPPLRSSLPHVGTTIFTVMSALAAQHKAVNLGQGFPDFAGDPALLDHVIHAMQAGHNQYPAMLGVMLLRESVATKIEAIYARQYSEVDPEFETIV